jgi:amino acid permease
MGAAIFTLPAGIAGFSNSPHAIVPTTFLLAVLGGLSAYCFSLIGRVCAYVPGGATSYKEAWTKSVGESSSWIPNTASLLTTLQAIVSYSIVLSSTIPKLLGVVGISSVTRRMALLGVTGLVLLPLCLLKSLSALAPFSLVGITGILYTAIAMTIRFLDGSYHPGGIFFVNPGPSAIPRFGTHLDLLSPTLFLLASKIGNAFMAHYQAPTMYKELQNNTIPRFQKVVGTSYLLVFGIYTWITCMGYRTFGADSQGFILNSYSTQDHLLSASRFAIFVSLLFSFPLTFNGFRQNVLATMGRNKMPKDASSSAATASNKQEENNAFINVVTVGLLGIITTIAYFVTEIGTLLSFGGGTYVCWMTFLFPPYMFWQLAKKDQTMKREIPLVVFTMVVGSILSFAGTKNFLASYFG